MARDPRAFVSPLYRILHMSARERIGTAFASLIILTFAGTLGYMLIEDMTALDSLFMTIITLSTVGYSEVQPLSAGGKIFSIILITTGIGSALYTVGAIAEFFLEGQLGIVLWRRAMMKSLATLENHIIVCGYGRLGSAVAAELQRSDVDVVVIDPDPELEAQISAANLHHLIESALEDSTLIAAGITRARAIVITPPRDADSVFIALSARQLNPRILIHSRAETETGAQRLRLAGANQVILPHQLSGQRIANALVRPAVVDFIELSSPGIGPGIDMEELIIGAGSTLDGGAMATLPKPQPKVLVVAVQRPSEPMRLSPEADEVLRAGDRVVVVGERQQLQILRTLLNPPTPP